MLRLLPDRSKERLRTGEAAQSEGQGHQVVIRYYRNHHIELVQPHEAGREAEVSQLSRRLSEQDLERRRELVALGDDLARGNVRSDRAESNTVDDNGLAGLCRA